MIALARRWNSPVQAISWPTSPPDSAESAMQDSSTTAGLHVVGNVDLPRSFFLTDILDGTITSTDRNRWVFRPIPYEIEIVPAITGKSDAMTYRSAVLAPLLALIATPFLGVGVIAAILGLVIEDIAVFFWAMVALFVGAACVRVALILRPRQVTKAGG